MTKKRAMADSWRHRPLPAQHDVLEVSGSYTREEYVTISHGFIPQTPEDKWFIYLDGEWLYFHRSWTGTCVFKLRLVPANGHYEATEAVVNRDPAQYRSTDDAYDVSLIAHLIDRLLLGRFSPFPQMGGLSEEDQQRHRKLVMGKEKEEINLDVVDNGRSHNRPADDGETQ